MTRETYLYNRIKSAIIKYECYNVPSRLNEDTFQETLYKCYKMISENYKGMSDDDIVKYCCKSYRINNLRDKLYFRNQFEKCYDVIFETPSDSRIDSQLDLEIINNSLMKKFSADLVELFNKHIYEGYSISELERVSGKQGLKYQFSKIKTFIKTSIMDK